MQECHKRVAEDKEYKSVEDLYRLAQVVERIEGKPASDPQSMSGRGEDVTV
jgi:hypothetical protein